MRSTDRVPRAEVRPALVGRDAEWALLTDRLDTARAGGGSAVLVLGEAGIGKSRLLAELAERARAAGDLVLVGRAVPGGGSYRPVIAAMAAPLRDAPMPELPQLRPFRAALATIAPGWTPAESFAPDGRHDVGAPGGPDPAVVLGEGLIRLLAALAGDRTCLLVLEDLHWADADTRALLLYLTGALDGTRILLAASARDDEAFGPAGGGTAPGLTVFTGATTIRLSRFDDASVAALAAGYAGDIPAAVLDLVVARADGLPVLVGELLDALLDPAADPARLAVPPSLAGLVRQRTAGLGERDRRLLGAAAVLGAEPDWGLLGQVTGLSRDDVVEGLRAATDAGLLVADGMRPATGPTPAGVRPGPRLEWRHAMVGDAVLTTLLPPERTALARRAAEALAARGRPGDEALAADLFAMADEPERAAALFLRQARRDVGRGALRAAAELVTRAQETGALRDEVMQERVHVLTLAGRGPEALAAGAPALAGRTGDAHAELCLLLARAAVSSGRWDAAEQYVGRAGRPADPRASVLLADAAFGRGDPARAAGLATTAAEQAERAGRADVLCAALVVAARCAILSDISRAAAIFERAAQLAAEHGLPGARVEAMFGLGQADLLEREDGAALERARDLALDSGMLRQALSVDVLLAEHALVVSGPRVAAGLGQDVADRAGALDLTGLQALGEVMAAGARAAADDVPGMTRLLESATARPHVSVEVGAIAAAVRALPALLAHDLAPADRGVAEGMSTLAGHGSAAPVAFWGLWALLRTVVADDDGPRRFLSTAPAGLRRSNRAALAYADAVAAGRDGRPADALAAFEAGEALHVAGWWHRLIRLLVLRSAVLDGWGDPVPALRADLAEFERFGDERLARTCRDLLRQAGAPTRRGRGSSTVPPDLRARGVTSRELDVLELVAGGLPNADIAARLFLSPRTIETHVTNLLAKTGCADRAALRRLWTERG